MPDVQIYTKPGCPHCAAAKADFERRGIRYVEHNAKDDPVALQRMLELNGGRRHVPTIVDGDQITVGFDGF